MEIEVSTATLRKIRNFILIIVAVGAVLFVLNNANQPSNDPVDSSTVQTEGDTQIVSLTAKGGYSPRNIQAKAGVNTTLRVVTNKTFDCSSSMRIPKLNIQKSLPATGTTDIALGTQTAGTQITVICTMGMYSAIIKFT
jgi:plastocyanin domain-containing protein